MNRPQATIFNTHLLALSLVTLALAQGCSRQTGMSSPATDIGASPQPFARLSDGTGMSPTGTLIPEAIPAGTPITIRLRVVVSSEGSHAGDSFAAVLDEPIIVHDQTVAPRGVPVTGKVLTAKPSDRWHDPGYLRLTLASISIHGRLIPLQASSIFAKGSSGETRTLTPRTGIVPSATSTEDVGFSPDRRLTFRLTQSLPVDN